MKSISLEELLEAGCHFGHQVTRQNPKARDYVFEERDNIHIIDLEKTKEGLEEASAFVQAIGSKPDATMIILGTKRQAQEIVREEVQRAQNESADGLFSVTNRWIGGTMTNIQEVSKNFKRLREINALFASEYEKAVYTKKELLLIEREKQKLLSFYGGIVDMTKIPDVIFIIDTHLEFLAVREARAMGVKVVGITDTNADPTIIDYAIPANDDAVGSIKLITSCIVDAWIEGKKQLAKGVAQRAEDVEKKEEKGTEEPRDIKKTEDTKGETTKSEGEKAVKSEEKKVEEVRPVEKKEVPKKPKEGKPVSSAETKKKAQ